MGSLEQPAAMDTSVIFLACLLVFAAAQQFGSIEDCLIHSSLIVVIDCEQQCDVQGESCDNCIMKHTEKICRDKFGSCSLAFGRISAAVELCEVKAEEELEFEDPGFIDHVASCALGEASDSSDCKRCFCEFVCKKHFEHGFYYNGICKILHASGQCNGY